MLNVDVGMYFIKKKKKITINSLSLSRKYLHAVGINVEIQIFVSGTQSMPV